MLFLNAVATRGFHYYEIELSSAYIVIDNIKPLNDIYKTKINVSYNCKITKPIVEDRIYAKVTVTYQKLSPPE